jgi:hypothetical protein
MSVVITGAEDRLGERAQLVPRLGPVHALPGVQHGPLGSQEKSHGLPHIGGIAGGADHGRQVVNGRVDLRRGHVARQFEHHRRAAARAQQRERAPQPLRHALGHGEGGGPLGHAAVRLTRAEAGRQIVLPARAAAGEEEEGRAVRERLRYPRVRVLRSGTVLHGHDSQPPAVRRAGVAVRHVHQRPLRASDDRADADGGARVDQWADGKAEEVFNPLLLENPGDGCGDGH